MTFARERKTNYNKLEMFIRKTKIESRLKEGKTLYFLN